MNNPTTIIERRRRWFPRALILCVALGAPLALRADPPGVSPRAWTRFRGDPRQTGVAPEPLDGDLIVRWKYEAPDAIISTAAIARGAVFVGCDNGVLYALDLATGNLKWSYEAGLSIRSSPTVIGSSVLFGDGEGVMHAVDARTGTRRWTFKTAGEIIASVNYATPDRVVFGSYDGFVYCLSPTDGKLIWKFETQGRVHGTPAIADGFVIAAGCDEFLHVLRLSDGTQVTRIGMNNVSGASAAVRGTRAFVGTYGNTVLGLDFKAGKLLWTYDNPDRPMPFMSSCAAPGNLVIVGGRDRLLRALDAATGTLRWQFATKGRVESSPVVAGDRVYCGSSDGTVFALRLATGTPVWRFDTGSSVSASPAIADGCLVIGTEDGVLYCFMPRPGT